MNNNTDTSVGILTLSDTNLSLTYKGNNFHCSGFSLVQGKDVVFGDVAWKQSRLFPLDTCNDYWHRLSLNLLPKSKDASSHHIQNYADLAFKQLMDLRGKCSECKKVIVVIPASFSREQLSLLLGILEKCELSVAGLIDSAITNVAGALTTSNHFTSGSYAVIDVQLHQCLLNVVQVNSSDQSIKLVDSITVSHAGLLDFYQHWINALTQQFIKAERFDPLHSAEFEQSLYNQLPNLVTQTHQSLSVKVGEHTLKTDKHHLMEQSQAWLHLISRAVSAISNLNGVVLSEQSALIPELKQTLTAALTSANKQHSVSSGAVVDVNHKQALCAIYDNYSQIIPDREGSGSQARGVRLLTSLSSNKLFLHTPNEAEKPGSDVNNGVGNGASEYKSAKKVTHLLFNNKAYPLGNHTLFITSAINGTSHHINKSAPLSKIEHVDSTCKVMSSASGATLSLLNGEQVNINSLPVNQHQILKCGDEISFTHKDHKFMCINVLEEGSW